MSVRAIVNPSSLEVLFKDREEAVFAFQAAKDVWDHDRDAKPDHWRYIFKIAEMFESDPDRTLMMINVAITQVLIGVVRFLSGDSLG